LQRYGNTPEVVKQLDTPESRRDIANRLVTEKTVDRLIDINSKNA
jgi:trigger factor